MIVVVEFYMITYSFTYYPYLHYPNSRKHFSKMLKSRIADDFLQFYFLMIIGNQVCTIAKLLALHKKLCFTAPYGETWLLSKLVQKASYYSHGESGTLRRDFKKYCGRTRISKQFFDVLFGFQPSKAEFLMAKTPRMLTELVRC